MITRELFTDDEWREATALPGLVVMAASLSDGKTLPSIRELQAGSEALLAGAARHPDNLLLQQVEDAAAAAKDEAAQGVDAARPTGAGAALDALVADIERGAAVVRANVASEDFAEIREVLLAAATAVVERIGTGFMGGGERVSGSETAFVDRLRALLA